MHMHAILCNTYVHYFVQIYGGGFFKSNDRFDVSAQHLVAVYSGGEINLDHGGYLNAGPGVGHGK